MRPLFPRNQAFCFKNYELQRVSGYVKHDLITLKFPVQLYMQLNTNKSEKSMSLIFLFSPFSRDLNLKGEEHGFYVLEKPCLCFLAKCQTQTESREVADTLFKVPLD